MPEKKPFSALDLADTAALLCMTKRQVQNLVELGLPKHGSGHGAAYDWAEVFPWYLNYRIDLARKREQSKPDAGKPRETTVRGETLSQATTRKVIAEADLKEIERARERGQVVAIADVERNIAEVATNVKTKLLALPSKLATIIAAARGDRPKIRAILDSEMRQVCSELATMKE